MKPVLRSLVVVYFLITFLVACGAEPALEAEDIYEEEYFEPTAELVIEETLEPTIEPTIVIANLPEPVVKDVFALGDVAAIEAFLIQVEAAEVQADWGDPMIGSRFVAVDVKLQNTAAEAQDVAMLVQFLVEDASGQAYAIDTNASWAAAMSLNGQISAGELAQAVIGFQVPNDAQDVKFVFRTIDLSTTTEAERVAYALSN